MTGPAADKGDAAGWEDGVLSYLAPGPAGRTMALPLRSRIPPFSLSLAWVSPPGKAQKQAPLCEQKSSSGLDPPAGSSRSFKAELRTGFLQSGSVVLGLDVFPLVLPLPHLIPPPPSTGPSRCSDPLLLLLLLLPQRILQTWQRCCNNSTSSLPVISGTLTVPSRAAREIQDCSFVPITTRFGPIAPSRFFTCKDQVTSLT